MALIGGSRLDWDSDFFGRDIWHLHDVDEYLRYYDADACSGRFIQAKLKAKEYQHIDALQKIDFQLADSDVFFEKNVSEQASPPQAIFHNDPLEFKKDIVNGALTAFPLSRFRPPWFKTTDASQFYARWAENALNKTYDDVAFVAVIDKHFAGFVSAKMISDTTSRVGLIYTHPDFMGQGLGKKLLTQVECWSKQQGARKLSVATQGANTVAINFYLRNQFTINDISYWLYK